MMINRAKSSGGRQDGYRLCGCLALAALGPLLAGCAPRAVARRHLFAGFDTSGSMRPRLAAAAATGARLAGRLDPDRDELTLYRVERDTQELRDGPAPDSGTAMQQEVVAELARPAARPGTFPVRFWAEVARRIRAERRPAAVVLFSDGDNDDGQPEAAQAIRAAAADLSANPAVRLVAVCGVSPENRAALRAEFAPLGDRFELLDLSETDVERLAGQVDATKSYAEPQTTRQSPR